MSLPDVEVHSRTLAQTNVVSLRGDACRRTSFDRGRARCRAAAEEPAVRMTRVWEGEPANRSQSADGHEEVDVLFESVRGL